MARTIATILIWVVIVFVLCAHVVVEYDSRQQAIYEYTQDFAEWEQDQPCFTDSECEAYCLKQMDDVCEGDRECEEQYDCSI